MWDKGTGAEDGVVKDGAEEDLRGRELSVEVHQAGIRSRENERQSFLGVDISH
jgi:hypothetical protein